jgi:hypothetical protein
MQVSNLERSVNDKYYVNAYARVLDSQCLKIELNRITPPFIVNSPLINEWYRFSSVGLIASDKPNFIIMYTYGSSGIAFGKAIELKEVQMINLTQAYGAGNEPTLEYIQAHPEEFAWTPNPNDLIETVEIKNNLVGDLENLQGSDFEQHEDGIVTYTNEAEEGSILRVDIDGISDQPLRFRNVTGEQVVIAEHDQVDEDAIKKVEFQGNSVQLADKYREVSGTSVTIAPELHDKNVADKLVIGGNTTQYTESSNVVTDGLEMWLSGRNFSNSPATNTWKDLTGMNNGTASGFAFTSASGSDGNGGVVFDGVDDVLAGSMVPTSIYSIEVLVEIGGWSANSEHSWAAIAGNFKHNVQSFGFNIVPWNYNLLRICYGNGLNGYLFADIQINMELNAKTHLVVVYDMNTKQFKVYKNGIYLKSSASISNFNSSSTMYAVGKWAVSASGYNFSGKVDYVRFYNKMLTDAEVLQNYNAGLAIPIPNIAMPQEVKHVNSGSKILVHGKNLFNPLDSNIRNAGFSSNKTCIDSPLSESRVVSKTADAIVYNCTRNYNGVGIYRKLKPNTSYVFSATQSGGSANMWVSYTTYNNEADISLISKAIKFGAYANMAYLTTGESDVHVVFALTAFVVNETITATNIQIEEGVVKTAYEPFKGYQETTIPVTLKSIG